MKIITPLLIAFHTTSFRHESKMSISHPRSISISISVIYYKRSPPSSFPFPLLSSSSTFPDSFPATTLASCIHQAHKKKTEKESGK